MEHCGGKMKKIVVAVAFGLLSSAAFAHAPGNKTVNLLGAFRQGLIYDPQFQAERTTLASSKEDLPINRSFLLPTAVITGDSTVNYVNQRNALGVPSGVNRFGANQYGLTLDQPIFNFADWWQYERSKATVKEATANFGSQLQNLMIRVSTAYFSVLQARDVLGYTEVERRAVYRLLEQNIQRYKVGLGTVTDVYDSKAQYDNIIAQEIQAQVNLMNAREDLRAITGTMYPAIRGVNDTVPLMTPRPKSVKQWVATSQKQNLTVQASHFAVDSAKEQIKVQTGAGMPTLDGVALLQGTYTGNQGTGSVNQDDAEAGIQVDIPIFQGGLVYHQVKQAQFDYQTSLSNLQSSLVTAANDTSKDYNNVVAGVSKIKADKQAIESNNSSLESTEAAFKVGTRTIVDVLDAQTSLFNAQVQYATDLYSYILNTLQLRQDAGTLSVADLQLVNSWLNARTKLTGLYGSPYRTTDEMVKDLKATDIHEKTKAKEKEAKNLPVYTPQPETPWTKPVKSNGTSGATTSGSSTSGATKKSN